MLQHYSCYYFTIGGVADSVCMPIYIEACYLIDLVLLRLGGATQLLRGLDLVQRRR